MRPTPPAYLGAYVNKKTLVKALNKDLRPQDRFKALKEVKLNQRSVGKISVSQAKKIVEKLQEKEYLKTQIEGVGTYHASEKHLLKTMVGQEANDNNVDKVAEAEKKAVADRFARAENRMDGEGLERQTTKHQKEAAANRDKTKQRKIQGAEQAHIVMADQNEDLSAWSGKPKEDEGPLRPAFGHTAPPTAKPGQPPDKSKTTEKSKQAFDLNIG